MPAASPFSPPSERDACGIGFVAAVDGAASHDVVRLALDGLCGVRHRGAVASDGASGDGAGPRAAARGAVEAACAAEDGPLLAWRDVPHDPGAIGPEARAAMPALVQALFARPAGLDDLAAERLAHRVRRRAERAAAAADAALYAASCSFRTVTYKAMADAAQLAAFYPDLADPRFASALAVFHSRFSTNTAPTWQRAQPFRMLCHNGEINTVEGNVNLMLAREGQLGPGAVAVDGTDWVDAELLRPVLDVGQSDSAKLDAALELLVLGGRDVRHAQAMLVPQAWESRHDLDAEVREFHRYHACLVEPWDGPAALIFTDGRRVGAALDRNGLRPLRYHVRTDGLVIAASEVGAVRVDLPGSEDARVRRARLGPGQMLCVDPDAGGLQEDAAIKRTLAARAPYGAWLRDGLVPASTGAPVEHVGEDLLRRQLAYGFTKEDITAVVRPMATQGKEPVSSMGDDTPIESLSLVHRPVSHLLKQRFAQVTNPPIDHLREREVMSIRTLLGPRAALLTGCYPKRVGLERGSWHGVLQPGDEKGLHPDEITIGQFAPQFVLTPWSGAPGDRADRRRQLVAGTLMTA
ncbi:MAG: glutamate synthase central domain-containing protein, partial [Nitriliruptoraceae bacterium]